MLIDKLTNFTVQHPAAVPSRRSFLLGTAAVGGALVVGFRSAGPTLAAGEAAAAMQPLEAYIRIAPDNIVTILSSQFDMGQGAYFGIATLVNEELDAEWAQIAVIGAAGDPAVYGNLAWGGSFQGTGGSSSMTSSWERYRKAGAAARMLLKDAAAAAWGVPASEIEARTGMLLHGSGKSATYGAFAEAAAKLPVPADIPLKPKEQWRQIGNPGLRRFDTVMKTNGRHPFTIDIQSPDLKTAVMIHPPLFGATLKSFDGSKAKAIKGVVDVVAIPRGIAVVGDNMWAALKGRDAVTAEWDDSKAEKRGIGGDSRRVPQGRRRSRQGGRPQRRRCRQGVRNRRQGDRGDLRVPLPRPCGAGTAQRRGQTRRRRRRGDGRSPDAGVLSIHRLAGRWSCARKGAAAGHEDRRRFRPPRGVRRRRHHGGRGDRQGARLEIPGEGPVDP